MQRPRWAAALLTGCAALFITTGCHSNPSNNATAAQANPTPTPTAQRRAPAAPTGAPRITGPFRVGLVTDARGLDDKGMNHLAYLGFLRAENELNIQGAVKVSNSSADYVQNLTSLAAAGYNLVIAVGYLMDDAVRQVSKSYPNTNFVVLDDPASGLPNVTGVVFRTEQSGYLAGALAGLMQKSRLPGINRDNVVGIVGGESIPQVKSYVAGFEQGVLKTDPDVRIVLRYAHTFVGESIGHDLADQEIVDGADIIFQVAANVGIGVLQACHESGVYAIGVDSNERYLDPKTVLTSAMKGADSATYTVIQQARSNQLKAGILSVGVANGCVRLASPLPVVPKHMWATIQSLAAQMESGKIEVSASLPDTTHTKKRS